ncbi:hypothetical protein EJ04DRAFT_403811, partial [Polyplosphaeria fusca]
EAAQTPVTPVSSEALTSLLTLIKQDPHDEQSARRHQKLMNDEAKTRRKTKSEILGKARVMSYEDIEAARAKRARQN